MKRDSWFGITTLLVFLGFMAPAMQVAQAAPDPVTVNWLGGTPSPISTGVSWGVPWPKATVQKDHAFILTAANGKSLPLQTWPLAYWPDGSLKWSAFATVAGPQEAGPFTLTTAKVDAGPGIKVVETADAINIDTGALNVRIPKKGPYLIETLTLGDRTVASKGRLVCLLQNSIPVDVDSPVTVEKYLSEIKSVTLEQRGPVRAVVKFEGVHKAETGSREWLPFHVRLYFYPGLAPIKMVHTFVFDGDQSKDFIRGLGVAFDVPMKEEIQNRHVHFGGQDGGLWAEPIEPLLGYNSSVSYPGGGNVYYDQVAGKRLPNKADLDARSRATVDALAQWDDFRLIQPNASGFTIEKRTNIKSAWLSAGAGTRSSGFVFAGDVSGGLGVGVQHFWQSYPGSLEVRHAKADAAELRVWFWSPDAPAMDLRHYDDHAHGLNFNYEDVEEGLSTADGVARTHTLTLFPSAGIPTKEETARQIAVADEPPVIVCAPQYLHDVRAFGIWSLQDKSTPFKKSQEDRLDAIISYYEKAVDQWNWYGFWDFGDFMHGYDGARHDWRYDVGGFAWDNSEQGTDMVLWYSFLRTGRADIFRLAEAMSRHTGEVDCYHQGPMAGLGTRHGVRHWGDGAKEARISMAPYRRFYYYLTTDERTGDVMHEMLQSESAITRIDPMRKVIPPVEADKQYPARIRGGPDWFAMVGNWMTEWERTGNTKYRDKIYAGMDSIYAMPYWFQTSQDILWGFFPETGKLVPRDLNKGGYNLVNNMGGPEIMMELNAMIDNPNWMKVWLQYCRLSGAQADMLKRDQTTGTEGENGQFAGGGRQAGYVYYITKNVAYAQRALGGIGAGGRSGPRFLALQHLTGPDVLKPIDEGPDGLVTNDINQSSLQTIEILELCKDQLPTEAPAPAAGPGGGGGGARGRGRGGRGAAPATIPATDAAGPNQ